MAIYHLAIKPLSRSSGRSAVAAAAYRAGECLHDERCGREHAYTRRAGVLHTEMVLPEGAAAWTREGLWNAAERAEVRKDARTAREWELALPEELTAAQRRQLAVRFTRELAGRYGCTVDVCLHAPDTEGDGRNWHAHLLATTRRVGLAGLADKCAVEWSDAKRLREGLGLGRSEVEAVRERWAVHANQALEKARSAERIDHRGLAVQQVEALVHGQHAQAVALDREPQPKLGWKVVQMERRGVTTERGDRLRAVVAGNAERRAAVVSITQLREQLATRHEQERQQVAQAAVEREAALLAEVERQFAGKWRYGSESLVRQWRARAAEPLPEITEARSRWERHPVDVDARTWRETRDAVERAERRVAEAGKAIAAWHQAHPLQSVLVERGWKQPPRELAGYQDEHRHAAAFLAHGRQELAHLEGVWERKRPEVERQIGREREQAERVRQWVRVVDRHPAHFRAVWEREDAAWKAKLRDEQGTQGRERDRGGCDLCP